MEGMDAKTARTENLRAHVAQAGGPAKWAERYGGTRWLQPQVSQWISETNPKGIGHKLARDLESAMNLAAGSLDRPPESQPAGLDVHRLGIALTAMDKALADVHIQGKLGKLAAVLRPIYEQASQVADPDDPHQRALFDAFVREKLRGWDDGEGVGAGAGSDRAAAAKAPSNRRRTA